MYPRKHLTGSWSDVAGPSFLSGRQWEINNSSKKLELGKGKAIISSDCVNLMQLVIFLSWVYLSE